MGASKELYMQQQETVMYDDLQYEAWFEFAGAEVIASTVSEERRSIELHGNEIRRQLKSCYSLAQTYSVMNMIVSMREKWGNGGMVVAMADSLHLEVYQKQRLILEGI